MSAPRDDSDADTQADELRVSQDVSREVRSSADKGDGCNESKMQSFAAGVGNASIDRVTNKEDAGVEDSVQGNTILNPPVHDTLIRNDNLVAQDKNECLVCEA